MLKRKTTFIRKIKRSKNSNYIFVEMFIVNLMMLWNILTGSQCLEQNYLFMCDFVDRGFNNVKTSIIIYTKSSLSI